ncbi:hypothetical protein [Salipiger thiooxidans]|uniref:hypothetical protein n=1 Tax=Salipiger thiooxidans TaxID=282683 RepID=UPI001CFB9ADF|nr:hypothetical protein [Salipiger thiooxidans]
MSGCVVQLWLEDEDERRRKGLPFDLVETDFEDFASFLEAVDEDQLICASRLDTHYGENRSERVIHRRVPIAFRGRAVRRAELPTWRITEEVD